MIPSVKVAAVPVIMLSVEPPPAEPVTVTIPSDTGVTLRLAAKLIVPAVPITEPLS